MAQDRTRIIAGCMTGTSLDGLDVALVKITGTGLDMQAELLGHHALSMPDDLRTTLMSLASGEANEPIVYMRAARALGELHADGIERLMASASRSLEGEGRGEGEAQSRQPINDKNSTPKLDFITAHGQTIWHAPRDERTIAGGGPKSWQLFDPWPLVKRFNVPVCYDLRQADLIAGGEGAPLTPIADWVMYRSTKNRTVVNLGGVCNVTYCGLLGIERIQAADLFACNLLLDGIVQKLFPGQRYDDRGSIAASGKALPFAAKFVMADMLEHSELAEGSNDFLIDTRKSLGREIYNSQWVDGFIDAAGDGSPEDVLCSAVEEIASKVARLSRGEMILAGGGARNDYLVDRIRFHRDSAILSDDLGIPCEAREAMGFAVLGSLSQDGIPISLPQVTGATDPGVAGVWANP